MSFHVEDHGGVFRGVHGSKIKHGDVFGVVRVQCKVQVRQLLRCTEICSLPSVAQKFITIDIPLVKKILRICQILNEILQFRNYKYANVRI